MFRNNMTFRHRNCLDIDLYIVKVTYRGPKYCKMKVLYVNRNYNHFILPQTETVKVYAKDYNKWKVVF